MNQSGYIFTQNADQWSYYSRANTKPDIYWAASLATGYGLVRAEQSEAMASWQRVQRIAISTGSGTANHSNAMRILGAVAGNFSTSRIRQIAFTPKLTGPECSQMLKYLA
jgi:hypothetical protein